MCFVLLPKTWTCIEMAHVVMSTDGDERTRSQENHNMLQVC